MSIYACNCLNVILQSDKVEEITDIQKRDLSLAEQRDIFFNEKLVSCPQSVLKTIIVQPALTSSRSLGKWTIESCLACGTTFNAKLQEQDIVLIRSSLQTTQENINNLKKSSNFSPVFNLLVPELNINEIKENIDTNNHVLSNNLSSVAAVGLRKQLNQSLQSQLDIIEEMVRQYKEQKYAEYEAYRERAQKDHKILSCIINKARATNENDVWVNNNMDNGPPSPLAPPLQRRRLSSLKDAKKFTPNMIKGSEDIPPEEDSLDAEDIFDLEGMDSRNMVSDFDDYDSDPEGSNDEGIHIARPRGGAAAAADVARSLPIKVPNFPNERDSLNMDDYEEPQDIAASIKALARSVHGDVYELPRPRFSTQI